MKPNKYLGTFGVVTLCLILQFIQTVFPKFILWQALQTYYLTYWHGLPRAALQLFLYMFSHAGWQYLIGNMFVGIPVMLYVEHRLKLLEFIKFYLIVGIGSAVIYLLLPCSGNAIIGSSGAIFGCLAGSCVLFCETSTQRMLGLVVLSIATIPQLQALNMGPLLTDSVGYGGHVGGAIAGITYIAVRKSRDLNRTPRKR